MADNRGCVCSVVEQAEVNSTESSQRPEAHTLWLFCVSLIGWHSALFWLSYFPSQLSAFRSCKPACTRGRSRGLWTWVSIPSRQIYNRKRRDMAHYAPDCLGIKSRSDAA